MAGYSADVSLVIEIDGESYRLSHCKPSRILVHVWEKKALPPTAPLEGVLVVTVDGNASRSKVRLPQGLNSHAEWTPFENVSDFDWLDAQESSPPHLP